MEQNYCLSSVTGHRRRAHPGPGSEQTRQALEADRGAELSQPDSLSTIALVLRLHPRQHSQIQLKRIQINRCLSKSTPLGSLRLGISYVHVARFDAYPFMQPSTDETPESLLGGQLSFLSFFLGKRSTANHEQRSREIEKLIFWTRKGKETGWTERKSDRQKDKGRTDLELLVSRGRAAAFQLHVAPPGRHVLQCRGEPRRRGRSRNEKDDYPTG